MVYLKFFGLETKPFHPTPDPHFLYLSASHKQALGSLIYGIMERKGFILVTGQVGLGKTTILRAFMSNNAQENQRIVYLLNPNLSFLNLLTTTLRGLEQEPREGDDEVGLVEQLHMVLIEEYRKGKTVVLLIDEAQNMPVVTLEYLRMLSNLETTKDKLLQIVLIGQPELNDLLDRFELRQLRQRIAVQAILSPLSISDSYQYIQFRMDKAGGQGKRFFSSSALRLLVREGQGIPRRLNVLCDNALVTALGYQQPVVTSKIAKEVIGDLTGEVRSSLWKTVAIAAGVVMVGLSVFLLTPMTYSSLLDKDVIYEFGQLFGYGNPNNQSFAEGSEEVTDSQQPVPPPANSREGFTSESLSEVAQGKQPKGVIAKSVVGALQHIASSDAEEAKDAVVTNRTIDSLVAPGEKRAGGGVGRSEPRLFTAVPRHMVAKTSQGDHSMMEQRQLAQENSTRTVGAPTVEPRQSVQVSSSSSSVIREVAEDDTFEGLIRSVYGQVNPFLRRVVLRLNPHIGDGTIIFPGQKIAFPSPRGSESQTSSSKSVSLLSLSQQEALSFSKQILASPASSTHMSLKNDSARSGKLYAVATTKEGDTLEKLAKEVYGVFDPGIIQRVLEYNPHIRKGKHMVVGQRIIFPRIEKK